MLAARLRGRDGCPWDQEQTRDSMKRYILEECYELVEAIDGRDETEIAEELGDVMFHLAFQIHLGAEQGTFTHEDVFGAVVSKLVRRHPHVFGDAQVSGAREVESSWEQLKRDEGKGDRTSTLDGVPKAMPALSHAHALQERAARSGFDWDHVDGVLEKVREEIGELQAAGSQEEIEAELGDVLFSVVNVGRWLGTDPEAALRKASDRFQRRFSQMERVSRSQGVAFERLSMDEKQELWEQAKGATEA